MKHANAKDSSEAIYKYRYDMDALPRKAVVDGPLQPLLEKDENFNTDLIKCPVCGFDYSHAGSVQEINSDQYKAWDGRGSCIIIPFAGECGHAWNLCIGFHKGQNFVFVDIVTRATRPDAR